MQTSNSTKEDSLQDARADQPAKRIPRNYKVGEKRQFVSNIQTLLFRDVASEMKLLLDAAGRLAPLLPDQQRVELDMARRKLLETSRSFSNALKGYFKEPQ